MRLAGSGINNRWNICGIAIWTRKLCKIGCEKYDFFEAGGESMAFSMPRRLENRMQNEGSFLEQIRKSMFSTLFEAICDEARLSATRHTCRTIQTDQVGEACLVIPFSFNGRVSRRTRSFRSRNANFLKYLGRSSGGE